MEAVGPKASRFSIGERVFGETVLGFQWKNRGALAEYAAVPETALGMEALRRLLESGALTPRVDRVFPLDAVPEAIGYLKRACGRVLIAPRA